MPSYKTRCLAIFILGFMVGSFFLVCFNLTPDSFKIYKLINLFGMILGVLIVAFAVRNAPDEYVPEIILAAAKNDARYLGSLVKKEDIDPRILSVSLAAAAKNGADKALQILLKNGADPNYDGYARSLHSALCQ